MARSYLGRLLGTFDSTGSSPGQGRARQSSLERAAQVLGAYANDPLVMAARRGFEQGTPSAPSGVSLVGDQPTVSTHGKHTGEAHMTVDLGGGMRANVYYDRNGRRQVEKYRIV